MKKSLTIFTISIYMFQIGLFSAFFAAIFKHVFWAKILLSISLLSLMTAFVMGSINIVMSLKERKQQVEQVFGMLMKFKLMQIPFYLINFLFWGIFVSVTGNPFLFWAWIFVPIGIGFAYSVLLSTSICEIVYLWQNRQRISKTFLHIVLQLIFVLDVIDSIWLTVKSKKMAKKVLGIVSTNYHLLVFLFLKETCLKDYNQIDLVVTDKTPYMEEVYQKGAFTPFFDNVYFADGRKIKNPYKNAITTLYESFVYNKTTKKILEKQISHADGTLTIEMPCKLDTYDDVYFASPGMPDEIVKELGKTLIKKNKNVEFHRFEDGFASYTKSPEHFINTELGQKLYRIVMRYDITEKEKELLLFEPYLAEKNVGFDKRKIEKGEKEIAAVIDMVQKILAFKSSPFSEKFVFLGQGTENGMGNPKTYQSLILEIKDKVGYEKMIVKPHPRGKYDDFKGAIKVYKDPCPFELAVANGDMEGKVLISYYSTACVSAKLLFKSNCKIIFLNKLAADSFNEKCDYEDYFSKVTEIFDDIYIPKSKEELFALLRTM